jgi:ribosome biogenesis GTPase
VSKKPSRKAAAAAAAVQTDIQLGLQEALHTGAPDDAPVSFAPIPTKLRGRVIAAFGRHYTVEFADGSIRQCYPRGKKGQATVGDEVDIAIEGQNEGAIDAIVPRRNLLYRSDDMRSKQFAANVDQLLVVVATEPEFSGDLVGRALAGAWSVGISPVLLLNKIDRPAKLEHARRRVAQWAAIGVPVIELSAHDLDATRATLAPILRGKTSILLGQSAMGKSTLLNALVPDAMAATREHSEALNAGKHTTTSTRLYHLPPSLFGDTPESPAATPTGGYGDLIDSPGFQGFGLQHLSTEDIERGFPEFATYAEDCRFYNCTHRHEPGCAVVAALEAGKIHPDRYQLYTRILGEIEAAPKY